MTTQIRFTLGRGDTFGITLNDAKKCRAWLVRQNCAFDEPAMFALYLALNQAIQFADAEAREVEALAMIDEFRNGAAI